jgi:hypothetical protein
MSLCVLALVLANIGPDSLPARIAGLVTDAAGHPVGSAEVRLDTAQWRHVSGDGRFTMLQVVQGKHLLIVRAPGYSVDSLRFAADPGESIGLTAVVHRFNVLAGVTVVGRADTARPAVAITHDWTEGFADRKSHNIGGTFLDQTAIERKGATRMTELLRSVPGVRLFPMAAEDGVNDYKIVMRGGSTLGEELCPIQYYLDGHPFDVSDDLDHAISPHNVAAMEIYAGASQVPEQFKGPHSRCGVIVIWTTSAGAHD